jgi:hypothetical protein
MTYLLDAVDKLTLNHITKVEQERNGIHCISTVDHEPLLRMLRDSVAGGTSPHAGATQGRERIPLNVGAAELFDSIAKKINSWYAELPDHREERHIWDRLRDWYIDWENRRRAGKVPDVEEHDTLRLVEGWARSIEAMFDPPTTMEITEEYKTAEGKKSHRPVRCPSCGERYARDPKTGDQTAAIVVEYRNLGVETLDKATGVCRFCGDVWHGRYGIRELRWLIDSMDVAA